MTLDWQNIDEAKKYLGEKNLKEWASSIYIFEKQKINDYLKSTYPISDWEMDKNSKMYNSLKKLSIDEYTDSIDPASFSNDYKHNLNEFIKDGDEIGNINFDDISYDLFDIGMENSQDIFDKCVSDYLIKNERAFGFNTNGRFDEQNQIEESAEEKIDDLNDFYELDDNIGDIIALPKRIDYDNRDAALIYLDGEVLESHDDETHAQILQHYLEDEGREDEIPQDIIDNPRDGSRPSLNRMKRLVGTEEVAFGHVVNDCAFIEELANGANINDVANTCKDEYSKVYQYDGRNRLVKRVAKLSIKPNDSLYDDFVLSLSDYFCKEFNNRGLCAKRNQGYVSIQLPQLYKEKYHSVIVDCGNGYVYLRGDNCNDKKFGKLSKYNPQRKSDAYNCVNYNITRLVNRINNLDYGICDLRTAKIASEVIDLMPEDFLEIPEENVVVVEPTELDDEIPVEFLLEDNQSLEDIPVELNDIPIILEEYPEYFDDEVIFLPDHLMCVCEGDDIVSMLIPEYDDISEDDFLEVNAGKMNSNITPEKEKQLYDEHPNLKDITEYGDLNYIYKDSIQFEQPYDFNEKDMKKWCLLWDNVIVNRFIETFNVNKSDIELNDDIITLYTDNLYNCEYSQNYKDDNYESIPGKIFFKPQITGWKYTYVDYDGNKLDKDYITPDINGIHFEYAGEKS